MNEMNCKSLLVHDLKANKIGKFFMVETDVDICHILTEDVKSILYKKK